MTILDLKEVAATLPLEIWRGSARAWECDEMGHQNSSFYIAQANEGLSCVAAVIGASPRNPDLKLGIASHHLRFMREIAAGTSLHMRAGVVALEKSSLLLIQILLNSETGEPCATILTTVQGKSKLNAGVIEWGETIRFAASNLVVDCAATQFATAIPIGPTMPHPDAMLACAIGLTHTALGCFQPNEGSTDCESIRVDTLIGRISDATRFLSRLFERTAQAEYGPPSRLGTAALECRLDYISWPKVGDRFVVYSGYTELGIKSRRVVHWMFDADSKQPICVVHTLEVNFDLERRCARPVGPEVRRKLERYVVEQLKPNGSKHG